MSGEIEDETHFMLDCNVYEDLRQRMLEVVSSTLSRQRQPIETETARKTEEGRKQILAALMASCFLRTRTESSSAAFLQEGNETQKHYRSGKVGSKDVRMWTILDLNRDAKRKASRQ